MKSFIALAVLILASESFGKQLPTKNTAVAVAKAAVEEETPAQHALDPTHLPINWAVNPNSWVLFECAVVGPSTTHRVQWTEFAYFSSGSPISDNEFLFDHPQKARYEIVRGTPYEYSLKINPVVMADGGAYLCNDANANTAVKKFHSAQLTVVAAAMNCTSTIRSSGIVIENQYVTNDCTLDYKGGLIPNITWSGVGPFVQVYVATPTSVWAGMHFNATREMDTKSHLVTLEFSGYFLPVDGNTAANIPVYDDYYSAQQMFIYWGPTAVSITPVKTSYVVDDVLTCNSDARPTATYLWQNLRTNQIYSSQSIIIPSAWLGFNQTMRCEARNTIEGVNYIVNTFLNVDVPPITTPAPTTPPTTTTSAPAVAACTDLTGAWSSPSPLWSLCIFLDLNDRGSLYGMLKNGTDSFWIDIGGRAQLGKFDQVGFSGIWPKEVGVSTFVGECHRCYGEEVLLINAASKPKGKPCGVGAMTMYSNEVTFRRSTLLQCPNFPKP